MTIETRNWLRLRIAAAGLCAALVLAGPALAQVTDYLGLPGPIMLGKDSFELAWSSRPSEHYIKQEYVPGGQEAESYQQMLLVETVTGGIGVMEAVGAQVRMLEERKASDPLVNMEVIRNEQTGEAILDFIVSSKDQQGGYTVEWNAYRFASHTDAQGQEGVMLFGISHRAYGNANAQSFMQELSALRADQVALLAQAPLPRPGH
jgi:hypothetical protein